MDWIELEKSAIIILRGRILQNKLILSLALPSGLWLHSEMLAFFVVCSSSCCQVSLPIPIGFLFWCFCGRQFFTLMVSRWCGIFAFAGIFLTMKHMILLRSLRSLVPSRFLLTRFMTSFGVWILLGFSQLTPLLSEVTSVSYLLLLIQPSGLAKHLPVPLVSFGLLALTKFLLRTTWESGTELCFVLVPFAFTLWKMWIICFFTTHSPPKFEVILYPHSKFDGQCWYLWPLFPMLGCGLMLFEVLFFMVTCFVCNFLEFVTEKE